MHRHLSDGLCRQRRFGARLADGRFGPYVIFFRVLDDQVRIERVLHGARNLPIVLEHDSKRLVDDAAFD